MPRARRTYLGSISDVAEAVRHAAGYRVRFKHNGEWTDAYRSTKEEAKSLYDDLLVRAAAAQVRINVVKTWLNEAQVQNAELAYTTLINGRLVEPTDPTTYQTLVKATEKIVQAMDRREGPVELGIAYAFFMEKQSKRDLSSETLRDYRRFLDKFVAKMGPKTDVRTIGGQACQEFVTGFSGAARFKCHGYLAAFFKFCAGKHNSYLKPGEKPWIPSTPMNFEKNAYVPHQVRSYNLEQTKALLRAAKATGALGYILFRLYSMARYDETLRFLKHGDEFDKNQHVDLSNDRIHFTTDVFKKRSKKANQGRHIPIVPAFRRWIDFCIRKKISFKYDRVAEEAARREVKNGSEPLFGPEFKNMLRHTAITMRVKLNDVSAMEIAKAAGTSTAVIETNYLNSHLPPADAAGFFRLSPRSFGW